MELNQIIFTKSPYIFFNSNPYTDELVNNWQLIRDEYLNHIQSLPNYPKPKGSSHFAKEIYSGQFDLFSIMLRSSLLDEKEKKQINWLPDEKIRWMQHRMQDQPTISNWTVKHQDILGAVTYNSAGPGADLKCHWGLDPDYLRLHLCLIEDPGCAFNIEGWRHSWKEGELFGFDDAHVLHGTSHRGQHIRTIVLIDILKSAIQPYAINWECRESRPPKEYWPQIYQEYQKTK